MTDYDKFDVAVIAGIPVDNAANRDFLIEIGAGDLPLPGPHADSEKDMCQIHGGEIWLGPQTRKMREERRRTHRGYIVACLVCAAVEFQQAEIVTLSKDG